MHANIKDRPRHGDDSNESRGAQVRSYVSQGGAERAYGAQGRRSPSKDRTDGN